MNRKSEFRTFWWRWLTVITVSVCLVASASHAKLPRQITEERLEKYLGYLNLSEAQFKHMQRLHQTYLDDWSTSFGRDISIINATWAAIYQEPADQFAGESKVEMFRKASEYAYRLKYKLKVANDFLFDQMEAILTEEQAQRMQRARLAHDRLCFRSSRGLICERQLDLVDIVEDMPLNDLERARVDAVLLEFEPVFVESLRISAEADERYMATYYAIQDIRGKSDRSRWDAQVEADCEQLRDHAGKLCVGPSKRLVQTIRGGLRRLLAVLEPSSAAELQRICDEQSYPEVYPDPAWASHFFRSAESIDGLSEGQVVAIAVFREQYEDEHVRLSRQMAKSLYDRSVIFYRAELGTFQQMAEIEEDRYRDLSEKREKLNVSQPPRIRALLLPEQNQQLPPWKYENQPPPKRWDPGESSLQPPSPPRRAPVTTRPSTQPATQPK